MTETGLLDFFTLIVNALYIRTFNVRVNLGKLQIYFVAKSFLHLLLNLHVP